VMYGFDTAGTLAEETHDPRRAAPPAILRALAAAALLGGLLILFALMSVPNIHDAANGLPALIKQVLGSTTGDVFLAISAVAITVCALAVCTACIRMMFSMARDGRLPAGKALARVSGRAKVPIIPALFVGVCALALLAVNLANQSAFVTLTSVAIVMFYLPYLAVTGSMLYRRLHGQWPRAEHGPYFNMGRFGFAVNLFAVVYGAVVAFNIAWPRADVYGSAWYFKFGAYEFIGASFIIGILYYFFIQRHKSDTAVAEAAAEIPTLPDEHFGEVAP
jgi:amino acid transporter